MAPSVLLHRDQVPTSAALVTALLRDQHPHLASAPVEPVTSSGTDHDVYRLVGAGAGGGDLAARLPKIAWARDQGALEARWLPALAPLLPLALPHPVAAGAPGRGYPFPWAVVTWLPGRQVDPARDDDERTADDLAALVRALRAVPAATRGAGGGAGAGADAGPPVRGPGRRGGPLAALDADVRDALTDLGDRLAGLDGLTAAEVLRCWEGALAAPGHAGPPVWAHGDLMPGNLLVSAAAGGAGPAGGAEGPERLTGVIDWGALGLADPAVDLQPAWGVLTGRARARFLDGAGADAAARARGRGTVVHQALVALPYYWRTNPPMVAQASRALVAAVRDPG